jgi:hypothetical protein
MLPKRHDSWLNEFTVFGVFVVVAFIGLLAGGAVLLFGRDAATELTGVEAVTAPTADEYHAEARQIMSAFLGSAGKLTIDDIEGVKTELQAIVATTQTRLLAVRIPSGERDAHLALVLLMEHWKRALAGSDIDQQTDVFQQTQDFIVAHPWIVP